jgi:prepilin-type N-terminal cleavage/methylation domain-containing protein
MLHRRKLNDNGARGGFTLVELMAAMVIFMIGALGLVALQRASIAGSTMSRDQTAATNLARFYLSQLQNEIRTWPRGDIDPAVGTIPFPSVNFPAESYPMLTPSIANINSPDPVWYTVEADNSFRVGEFLEPVATAPSPSYMSARFCVNYAVSSMENQSDFLDPAGNPLYAGDTAVVWKVRVRVTWGKEVPEFASNWSSCDPALVRQRIIDGTDRLVEFVTYSVRQLDTRKQEV